MSIAILPIIAVAVILVVVLIAALSFMRPKK
jgi:hypothetical protein